METPPKRKRSCSSSPTRDPSSLFTDPLSPASTLSSLSAYESCKSDFELETPKKKWKSIDDPNKQSDMHTEFELISATATFGACPATPIPQRIEEALPSPPKTVPHYDTIFNADSSRTEEDLGSALPPTNICNEGKSTAAKQDDQKATPRHTSNIEPSKGPDSTELVQDIAHQCNDGPQTDLCQFLTEQVNEPPVDATNFVRRGTRLRNRPVKLGFDSFTPKPTRETRISTQQKRVNGAAKHGSTRQAKVSISRQEEAHTTDTKSLILRLRVSKPKDEPITAPTTLADTTNVTDVCEDGIEPVPTINADYEELHRIATDLFAHREGKSEPNGQPEVWADGRQELCETLHYYRSYQSAAYCTGGFAKAFMFDKVAHSRDFTDEDVVISRAGGNQVKDKGSGELITRKDQNEDTTIVQGLKNCMKHFNPVVIIAGSDSTLR